MPAGIIGREKGLGAIEAFLERVRRGPAALVLSGEPGIGKTVLWERGVEQAGERQVRVLSYRGVEAEATVSFAALGDLLGDVLEEVRVLLSAPRRRALEVALLLEEPGAQPPDQRAVGLAFVDIVRALTASAPLLVAVDDVQWLDPASAGVLQFSLRRLRDEPAGLLATLRAPSGVRVPLDLDRTLAERAVERLAVDPLSLGAVYRLLAEHLGLALSRPELVRLHEVTRGNPFCLLELGRELERTSARLARGSRSRPRPQATMPVSRRSWVSSAGCA